MPKVDFASVKAPQRRTETRTFPEPSLEGGEVTFTFSPMGIAEQMNVKEDQDRLGKLISNPDDPVGNYLPAAGGRMARVSESLFWLAANLANMQAGPLYERYSAFDFLQMLINCPELSEEVVSWMWEVNGGKTDEGN